MTMDTLLNQIWFVDGMQLRLFDGNTKQVFLGKNNPFDYSLLSVMAGGHGLLRAIMRDSRADFWITTWGTNFYRLNHQTGKIISYDLASIKRRYNNNKTDDATLLINAIYEDNQCQYMGSHRKCGIVVVSQRHR